MDHPHVDRPLTDNEADELLDEVTSSTVENIIVLRREWKHDPHVTKWIEDHLDGRAPDWREEFGE